MYAVATIQEAIELVTGVAASEVYRRAGCEIRRMAGLTGLKGLWRRLTRPLRRLLGIAEQPVDLHIKISTDLEGGMQIALLQQLSKQLRGPTPG